MTTRQTSLTSWTWIFPTLMVLYIVALTSHPARGSPTRDLVIEDPQQEDRWLADGSFYDFEYVGDQPQADGVGLVKSDLCPPVPKRLPLGGCEEEACSSDRECAEKELKCCYNGCVYTCLPEVKPPPFFDWIREPVRRLQFGQSWLVPGPDDNVDVELCTTTPPDDDSDPLVCPHGYVCSIDDPGDPDQGVPNRGHCIKEVDDVSTGPEHAGASSEEASMEDLPQEDSASLHACLVGNEQMLLSGHSIVVNGRDCLCYETKLICDD